MAIMPMNLQTEDIVGNMKCEYCGKTISRSKSHWITIENDGSLKDLGDYVVFCDKNCFNPWKKNYLRKRSLNNKARYKEKLFENPERIASGNDLWGILQTLTKGQKDEMIMHMLAICYERSDKTVKGILQVIDGLKDDRETA